eukprot:CAMPEP_0176206562 /NCGR_PEP_ID=MMETSP0121_2-20121125/12170_1 /TAXON_ID=160619 /ORGANISM="Kryptoperidinium foliaceum, Strain CCMP 1326" /LENGTH=42 /DNA_ID= /DNA_START= /DNA_END= /DNA_ORIENTATION=
MGAVCAATYCTGCIMPAVADIAGEVWRSLFASTDQRFAPSLK